VAARLDHRRILVTRDAAKARATATAIEARGGIPVVFPTIAFAPPADPAVLRDATASLSAYLHVVVSSPTGASVLADLAAPGGLCPVALPRTRLAAVGRTTAAVLERAGAAGVLVPPREDAEGLLDALLSDGAAAGRTLVLRAEQGRDVVVEGLRAAGGAVVDVVAYRTVTATPDPGAIDSLLAALPLHAALFLSPSAFAGLIGILGDARARLVLAGARIVAIGPTTAKALAESGFPPHLVPARPDLETVLDALAESLASAPG